MFGSEDAGSTATNRYAVPKMGITLFSIPRGRLSKHHAPVGWRRSLAKFLRRDMRVGCAHVVQ
jgi:hypothetical protein